MNAQTAAQVNQAPAPTLLWSRVICKQPGSYVGWPTIARRPDGELLVGFSGDREAHRGPYGKNQIVRSSDDGETWSPPETVNNSPLDDRDTGLLVTRSGAVVMSWFTGASWRPRNLEPYWEPLPDHTFQAWKRHLDKISPEVREKWHGRWTRRSEDGGRVWEPPVDSIASAPHGPIQLADGRLLFIGTAELDGHKAMVSAESTDDARSWRLIGTFPAQPDENGLLPYSEPHAVELPDGRIVSLWRFQPRTRAFEHCTCHLESVGYCTCGSDDDEHEHRMRQSESRDGGKTWTVPRPTPLWGYPPHLIRLQDGSLLATYGRRWPPRGQRACLSRDEGETWDSSNEIVLRGDAPSGDLGYPATTELRPGELLTVYYQIDRIGEKTSLMATRWSLN